MNKASAYHPSNPLPIALPVLLAAVLSVAGIGEAGATSRLAAPAQGADGFIVVLDTAALGPLERTVVVDLALDLAGRAGSVPRHIYSHALKGFSLRVDADEAAALEKDWRVAFVEPDGMVPAGRPRLIVTPGAAAEDLHLYLLGSGISGRAELPRPLGEGFNAVADTHGTTDCLGQGSQTAREAAEVLAQAGKMTTAGAAIHPVRVVDCQGRALRSDVLAGLDWVAGRPLPAWIYLSVSETNEEVGEPSALRQALNAVGDRPYAD